MVVNTSNEESEREAGAPDPRGPPPQLPAPVSKVRRINYTAKCVLLALEAKAQELQASVMCHGDPHNPNEGGSAQAKHDARTKSLEAAGVLGDRESSALTFPMAAKGQTRLFGLDPRLPLQDGLPLHMRCILILPAL